MEGERFDKIVRRALGGASRRGVLRSGLGTLVTSALATVGFSAVDNAAAKKKKKKKKKKKSCRKGTKQCGKGCCGAASACRAGTCYCTGNESPPGVGCVDVASTLIGIIADSTGIPPGQIGANPQQPLKDQVVIDETKLLAINELIQKTFLLQSPVPYYTQGITAGAAIIREELAVKA